MAAVLVRRGTRLCCFHRELCRVVWRPQAALFSSNQSDRKQPRRTHIRKAKPQPAVDVSTLLEQIFSHRRPGTAPHASKSRTVQSSSISTKPPSTSSLKVSASNVPPLLKTEPAISAFPATSSLKQADGVVSPEHPPPQPKSTSQANLETSQDPLASLESEAPAVETVETKAGTEALDVSVPSKPGYTIDQTLETSSFHASTVEPVIKATVESQVDASPATVETITIEDPVEPAEDATVQSKSIQFPDTSQDPFASLESEALAVETVETEAVEAEVVEAEAVVQVVQTNSTDSVQVEVLDVTKEESVMETTDSLAETRTSSLETEVAVVEGPAEPTTKPVSATAAENSRNAHESAAVPFKNESVVETSLGNVTVEEGVSETEGISIESVMMESLKIEELLQTQYVLVEEDEKQFQCMLDQTESETEHQTKNEKSPEPESENLTEVLSKWESLTEDLQDLEGETRMLEKQFLYNDPVRLSRVETGTMSDPPVEDILKMDEEVAEAESMTLESLILAEVKAEVGRLETEELRETCTALEKEEEVVPKEETGVKTAATDADLALESLLDASDTLKADASHILEAVIFSEQGPVVGQKLGPREEAIIQEVEKESQGEEYRVLDGITNEVAEIDVLLPTLESTYLSKTIDCLEKAPDVLAKEEKMEVEDAAALEGMIGALEVDSLSEADVEALPEALQSDVLMEELLCFASGSVAKDPVSRIAATGLASVDKEATVTDGVPDPPALGEIVPELEEVKEEAMQTEALEVLKDLDPVQRLFLEKIKEYNTHSREAVVKEPDYERRLSEETAKLQRLYGGGDLNSFPQFTFTEPKMDQDTK
ncbi:uncharacterized protein LOC115433813 isoform X4 [Sphaeramia orbicularis]|uniref:uncharacterized protein LOC115433813 isoform X4 n=1 Tax=Sphaeramia orbicularis TaxID=375764 RepID=UPI00117FBF74|nr:uncharacterized protein LOC115433813 isoform X4 [Sphaeramia orbicularis]